MAFFNKYPVHYRTARYLAGAVLTMTLVGTTHSSEAQKSAHLTGQSHLIRSDYAPGEVTQLCKEAVTRTQTRLDVIATLAAPQRTFDNTVLEFETTMADFSDDTGPLTFMGYVSTDEAISAEGSKCEEELGQYYVQILTRRDLYAAMKDQKARSTAEQRLLDETLKGFENNGLKLSDDKLALVKDLMAKLSAKEAAFTANLNGDKSTVEFTATELTGVSADFLARLQKTKDGKYIVTTKSTDYTQVLENAVDSETRRRIQFAYLNRGGSANTQLLTEAVQLRAQIAAAFGFNTWADYRTNGRMAQNSQTVLTFLNGLKSKLAQRNQNDLQKLLTFKKESEPSATRLEQWDISYYAYQLKKRDFTLDDDMIREYFPADAVIAGMFNIYSQLLGVRYVEVPNAKVWATGVKLYEIREAKSDQLIAYFYADFIPRPGKYGHAAAFTLINGRVLNSGEYSLPVSSIVANFNPPADGKPSLLNHDEVETTFHEFGHIMHQTLTRAPYASLAGSSTARDFVEAPSQMLENWVWSPEILSSLSGHYLDSSRKLPADVIQKMMDARSFQQGYSYTKQLLYALFDMTLHTQSGALDVTSTYDQLHRDILGIEPIAGGHFPASFGHLMGGYDAGYYGYLWSDVYAADMFTQFQAAGLLDAGVGGRYRSEILEKGNMANALELLRAFLGREPSSDAFFKKLGI